MSTYESQIVPLQIWDGVVARAVAGEEATLAVIDSIPAPTFPSTGIRTSRRASSSPVR